MTSLSKCPVCANGEENLRIEHRHNVPTLQNITLDSIQNARNYPTAEIDMQRCAVCSFVWNDAFDESAIIYDSNYNNDVSSSGFYLEHLNVMADNIIASVPVDQPIHYVEIGCGNADFMKLVFDRSNGRCKSATGFDPSFSMNQTLPEEFIIHKTMFGPEQIALVSPETNAICSRHTIEHVPEPQSFISAIAKATSRNGIRLFLETPDVNWILENAAFQDFFYEHCSIYTPRSMHRLLAGYGLTSIIKSVYSGQYMWIEAGRDIGSGNGYESDAKDDLDGARHYIETCNLEFQMWQELLTNRKQSGKIAIWGAASKGVTFSLLISNHGEALIDCAIDLNSAKQGRYLPATALPVLSPRQAMESGVETVVIMNPNYVGEIKDMAANMEWEPEFYILNDPSG